MPPCTQLLTYREFLLQGLQSSLDVFLSHDDQSTSYSVVEGSVIQGHVERDGAPG